MPVWASCPPPGTTDLPPRPTWSARPDRAGFAASRAGRISSLPRRQHWRAMIRLRSRSRAGCWRTTFRPSAWPRCLPRCWRSGCVRHRHWPKPALPTRPSRRPERRSPETTRPPERPSRSATGFLSRHGRTIIRSTSGSSTSSFWRNPHSATRSIGNFGQRCPWHWWPPVP